MSLLLRLRTLSNELIDLHIVDGRLAPAGPADTTLDARHLYAFSGLGDGHLHLAAQSIEEFVDNPDDVDEQALAANAARQVRAGVVAALDKGDKNGSVLTVLDIPRTHRPDLEMAGPIHRAPEGYYPGIGVEAAGAALAEHAGPLEGATWFKVIGDWPRPGRGPVPSYSERALRAAVSAAHAAGRRVAVHTMAPETPSHAVAAGVDSIEHGLFLTPENLAALGARGGYWVPTVVAMEEVVARLGRDSRGGRLLQSGLDNVKTLLPAARQLGVNVLAGSDLSSSHGAIAKEAARLVDYGLDAADAVAAATTSVSKAIGKPHRFSPGDAGDVVCVAGDPRKDIRALGDVRLVVRMGRVVHADL
jgi:imidazolonepropionase-like amidohydrolase